jgi:predicted O-methyltransferase YrrM
MQSQGFRLLRYNDRLVETIYRDRVLPLEGGGTTPLSTYIPQEEGDYLYGLVRHYRPSLTIEVGMAYGLSTLFLAAAHRDNGPDGRHIAIDPYQHLDWRGVGMGLIRQAGLAGRVRLIEEPSHQALSSLEKEGVHSGLIFIDGSHLFDYVITDFLVSDRLLDTGGLIVFDDSDWPAVQSTIRYILANRHYEVAFPEVVIEPPPGRPSLATRLLRGMAAVMPPLGVRLRSDFLNPPERLKTQGRVVVLRKTAEEDRDSQARSLHYPF